MSCLLHLLLGSLLFLVRGKKKGTLMIVTGQRVDDFFVTHVRAVILMCVKQVVLTCCFRSRNVARKVVITLQVGGKHASSFRAFSIYFSAGTKIIIFSSFFLSILCRSIRFERRGIKLNPFVTRRSNCFQSHELRFAA